MNFLLAPFIPGKSGSYKKSVFKNLETTALVALGTMYYITVLCPIL